MQDQQMYLDRWSQDDNRHICIIRVTNKCNEECAHCCFSSGPNEVGQMSPDRCLQLNQWAPPEVLFNIMGGEFSILEFYPEILLALSQDRQCVRLVTNGYWARSQQQIDRFFSVLHKMKDNGCKEIEVSVSNDSWHIPMAETAIKALDNLNIADVSWTATGDLIVDDLTPVGRAWKNGLIPSGPVQCYCGTAPFMMIDESGMFFRCPFAYFPYKYFWETSWEKATGSVLAWRAKELSTGMTCVKCMERCHGQHIRGKCSV